MTIPKLPAALDHPLLPDAVAAAAEAGKKLLEFFRADLQLTEKDTANFVSDADLASEAILHKRLLAAAPDSELLAEESFSQTKAADQLWIVDPLDGTTNFVNHIPHFAVSIAFQQNQQIELGVVHNPYSDDWYVAVAGQGAYRWRGTHTPRIKMHVSKAARLRDALYCFGFFYDRDKAMAATLRCIDELMRYNVLGIRRFGAAALDLAAIADGSYGGFFEFELQPWDMAAGMLLVQEAGGTVTDCLGESISCHIASSLLATNGILHPLLLPITQKHFRSLLL